MLSSSCLNIFVVLAFLGLCAQGLLTSSEGFRNKFYPAVVIRGLIPHESPITSQELSLSHMNVRMADTHTHTHKLIVLMKQ